MPTWVYFYVLLIVLGTLFNLFENNRLKAIYQPFGEVLNASCCILIFLLAYNVIESENKVVISSLCFLFTFGWSGWAYQKSFSRKNFIDEIHKAELETEQELKDKLGDDFEPQYDFDSVQLTANLFYVGAILLVIFIASPLLYAYWLTIQV
ncbi:hypothetical protein AVL56_02680 [Alteromonas stellipolaris]|uniref:hypothetical protein n=1 Tax=Alteromonas stellipolaris TaxID=233316 RepID=UPI00076FE7C0|nr:hypothetical protein [Alteromonas stellipolaris]AMJ93315.1 hypothetical protein AVL56_02680 [Alteromonas stellipolaris]